MTELELHQILRRSLRFRDIEAARRFRDRAVEMLMLVQGCDGYTWVTTPADGTRLQREGYEVVR